jgi:sugar lactone lactonase YvrE
MIDENCDDVVDVPACDVIDTGLMQPVGFVWFDDRPALGYVDTRKGAEAPLSIISRICLALSRFRR